MTMSEPNSLREFDPAAMRVERVELSNEWHARPNVSLPPPLRCTHLVNIRAGQTAAHCHADFATFCNEHGHSPPAAGSRHHVAEVGSCLIKWESHTEATSHTVLVAGNGQPPFSESALDFVPENKRRQLLERMFIGVQVEVLQANSGEGVSGFELAQSLLGTNAIYGGWMAGQSAEVWSAFRLDARGFVRLVILDRGLKQERLARLLQRLLDLETYRMLSMRALPEARAVMTALEQLEPELDRVMGELSASYDESAQEQALRKITGIAARVEQLASAHASRFAGARAYLSIVEQRVAEVKEEPLDNHQRYTHFLLKSLLPAMRTCDAAERRTNELAQRVTRAANLLSTMVGMEQTRQSHGILNSVAERAKLQLRLQQAVEGFSIFAITYYAVGLLNYALKSARAAGLSVDSELLTGLAAPLVFALVYASVRSVRRRLTARGQDASMH
jgi:uncharacterized membrane-anchored protein